MNLNKLTPEQQFFRGIMQLAPLDDEQISSLTSMTSKHKYREGDYIFYQDDTIDRLFFLEMGEVGIYKSDIHGKKLTLWHIRENEMFCLANLFSPKAFASAMAVRDSMVYSLRKKDFETFLQASGALAHNFICCMCRKLDTYSSLLEDFAFRSIEVRLTKTLLSNFETTPEHKYCCSITQEELASRIGTSREVVGRCLKQLRERKLLTISQTGRPRLIIATDYPALVQIAEEDT